MKSRGKISDKWLEIRRNFLLSHPPNHEGYYECSLCPRWIHQDEITVDHIISRSRAPELRFVFSNLAFAHSECNAAKGSTAIVKNSVKQQNENQQDELDGLW